MAEHEGVVSVAVAAAGESETLMEACKDLNEIPLCEEDGGDVMVEIVGSDVFVDGIPGQVDEENLGREDGGGAEGDLRSVDEEEVEDSEAKTETPVDELQDVAGSADDQGHDAVMEDAQRVEEESQLVSREVETTVIVTEETSLIVTEETTTLNEEAQDSGIPTGEGVESVELTEVVTEKAVVEVSELNAKQELVEDGAEPAKEVDGAADEVLPRSEGIIEVAKSTNSDNSGAEMVPEPTTAVSADAEMETENDKASLDVGGPGDVTLDPSNEVVGATDDQVQKVGGTEQAANDRTKSVSTNEVTHPPVVESPSEQTKNLSDSNFSGVDDKIPESDLESPKSGDTDRISAGSENENNSKHEECVSEEVAAHVEQAHFAEIGDVPAVNHEDAMDIEGDVAEVAASSGKDQCLQDEVAGGVLPNDEMSQDLESSGKEIQMEDAVVEDGETVPDSEVDLLDTNTCLKKDAELNTVTASQITEAGIVKVNAEASGEQNKSGNPNDSIHEEPPVGGDPPPSENHVAAVNNDTLSAKDVSAQTADTCEVDKVQSMDSETTVERVSPVVLPNAVLEGDVESQVQALGSCADTHDERAPVSSSVSEFVESLSVSSDGVGKSEVEGKSREADETLPEQQVLDKCMAGNLVVDLDSLANEGKWKPEDEFVNENLSVPEEVLLTGDEDPGSGDHVELEFTDCFPRNEANDLCLDDPTEGQEGGQEHFTDTEMMDPFEGQDIDQEEAKHLDECSEESLRPGPSAEVHGGNYLLPLENEGKFDVGDLVWGKVKSHPWWPGQIFDPSDASEKAMKYHKKDCFLVAYFGDRTFAWNEASLLKPFWKNFSQIVKQSSSEAFQNAVSCALEEVSRRVQLGLACSCITKDVYEKIVSQNVQNTGIREDANRKSGVEKSTGVSSFAPHKLVEFMKTLAQSPSAEVDQLELVIAKAQLLAFNRSKDCYRLPSFQFCGGLLDESNSSEVDEVIDYTSNNAHIVSSKPENSSLKRKHNLKDSLHPRKKEKSLFELMGDAVSSPDSEDLTDMRTSNTLVSPSSNKRKSVDFVSDGSEPQDRRISIYAAKVSTTAAPAPAPAPKPSFKVGECISRVAGQLWSPSILKGSSGEKFRKVELRSDDSVRNDAAPLQTPDDHQIGSISLPTESLSLNDMLLQVQMAAREPLQAYDSVREIMPFFSDFRDSICLVHQAGRQGSSAGRQSGGRKRKVQQSVVGTPEEFEFDDVNDSYWTDRIIENGPEEQAIGDIQNSEQYQLMAIDPDSSVKPNRRPNSRKRYSNGNHEMTLVPVILVDERKRDDSPAELMLTFCVGDRIPSEMKLTNIFRRFGPLKESETEVDLENSRARVVFRRGSDAEVALSSSEKFSIFGSMVVHYQINYSPSNSLKDFPPPILEEQEEAL